MLHQQFYNALFFEKTLNKSLKGYSVANLSKASSFPLIFTLMVQNNNVVHILPQTGAFC
jgi:hypothetical protein